MSAAELAAGARFHLELAGPTEAGTRYDVRIETLAGDVRFAAMIPADGNVSFDGVPGDLPAWITPMLRAFVRTLYRAHTDRGEVYPRRIGRWRAAPAV